MQARPFRRLVTICFFLTGASGLIYQVVWSRYLALVFGAAQYSIATVVAAYMLGLGLGSYLLGRRADRTAHPARLYALLEIAVAAYALCSPWILRGVEAAFVALHRATQPGLVAATSLRFVLALLALALPTVLMGGTLPVLGRALVHEGGAEAARDIGGLYAINTLGAVAGTVLAGFLLVERIGLWRSLVLGAAINVAAGLAVLLARPTPAPVPPRAAAARVRDLLPGRAARFALVAAFVSGFASLADELVWTRVLGLLVGSSTYAFAVILSCFLVGIGAGSWYASRHAARDPARWVAGSQILAAAGALLLLCLLEPATRATFLLGQNPLSGWFELLVYRALFAAIVVVPATLGFGATFPALISLAARDADSAGSHVGLLYGANTLGAILGAISGGFVLLHYFSSYVVLRAGVIASLGLAAAALALGRRQQPARPVWPAVSAGTLVLLAALALPAWSPRLLDAGAPVYAHKPIASRLELGMHVTAGPDQVVFFREGPVSTVTVRDSGFGRFLRVNGKTDASNIADMATQIFAGLLPAAACPQPRSALVIGAGSGVTARAVASTPGVESIDVVEIEPAVIEAGRFFEDVNLDIYRDPRVHIEIADGRNALLTTTRRYDLIASEPSNPWMAGVANLFTREFYGLVRDHLAPGGVFCQWFQRYGLTDPTVRRMAATALASFEHVELWRAGPGDSLFLASREPISFDREHIRQVIAAAETARPGELQNHLLVGDEDDLLGMYLLGTESLRAYAGGLPPFVDDPPELEFAALRGLHADSGWQALSNTEILRYKRERADAAPESRPPASTASRMFAMALAHQAYGDVVNAGQFLQLASEEEPKPKYLRRLGDARARNGEAQIAETLWAQALQLDPNDPFTALGAARRALAQGDVGRAHLLRDVAAQAVDRIDFGLFDSDLALAEGRIDDALRSLETVASVLGNAPNPLEPLQRLGDAYLRVARTPGGTDLALASMQRVAGRMPRLFEFHMFLADTLMRFDRCPESLATLAHLEGMGMRVNEVYLWRANCLDRMGRRSEALAALRRVQETEPWRPELGELEDRFRGR